MFTDKFTNITMMKWSKKIKNYSDYLSLLQVFINGLFCH